MRARRRGGGQAARRIPPPLLLPLLLLAGVLAATTVANSQAVDCSKFSDCDSCLSQSNSTCGYCSLTGSVEREGRCLSLKVGGGECAPPTGTWVVNDTQCAAVLDGCFNYPRCDLCASAPMELNCGWCASQSACVAGTVFGPLDNSQCGMVGGWAFLHTPCTQQALCNQANGMNCTDCIDMSGCGSCRSTQRCEVGAAVDGAADGDCPTNDWYFGGGTDSQCAAPAVDACNKFGTCVECENAPPALSCGYCELTGLCSTGNPASPAIPGLCGTSELTFAVTGNWSFHSCPADSACENALSCAQCGRHEQCLWCEGNNMCVPGMKHPVPGHVCEGTLVTFGASCASDTKRPFPTAGALAILFMTVSGVGFFVRALLFFLDEKGTPRLGSHIQRGEPTVNFLSVCRRLFPALLLLSSLALKAVALALDQWSAWYLKDGFTHNVDGHTFYGLTHRRTMEHGTMVYTPYDAECLLTPNKFHKRLCLTLEAGGITTYITIVWSLVFSGALLLFGLVICSSADFLSRRTVLLWRAAGQACTGSGFLLLFWALSSHLIVHFDDSRAGLGLSWILCVVAFAFDFCLLQWMRRVVCLTPRPGGTAAPQEQLQYALATPSDDDAVMGSYARMDGTTVFAQQQQQFGSRYGSQQGSRYQPPQPQQHLQQPVAYGVPMARPSYAQQGY